MPALTIPEIRPSDLRLPDISRDDIARTISDIDVPDAVRNLSIPTIRRSRQRTRWPWLVGLAIAGVASWLVLTNDAVRERLSRVMSSIRGSMPDSWTGSRDPDAFDPDEPIAFDAATTAPIAPAAYSGHGNGDGADYPSGLGSGTAKQKPAKAATAAGQS
jgi:hypothetical protein